MSVTITEKRDEKRIRAWREVERVSAITVGIHEEEGAQSEAEGKTLAEIAEINEYGLGPPARPFISGWAEVMREEAMQMLADRMAQAAAAGKSPIAAAEQVAQYLAGDCQANISAGIPPENAQSTQDRKGSTTPLIDTGTLRAAIRGKAVTK